MMTWNKLLSGTLMLALGAVICLGFAQPEPLTFPAYSPERPILFFDSDMDTGIYSTNDEVHYVCNGEYVMTLPKCEMYKFNYPGPKPPLPE